MLELSQQLTSSFELEQVVKTLVTHAQELMQVDLVRTVLFKGRNIRIVDYSGALTPEALSKLYESNGKMLDGGGLSGLAWRTQEVVWTNDYNNDARIQPEAFVTHRDVANALNIAATLVVPVRTGDVSVGLLWFSKYQPYEWLPEEIEIAKQIAATAAIAIHNSDLYQQLQQQVAQTGQRNQELEALQIFQRRLHEYFGLKELLEQAIRLSQEATGADEVEIYLGQNQPLLADDGVFSNPSIVEGVKPSLMLHTLKVEGEIIGILKLVWKEAQQFKPEQLRFVSMIAQEIASAISRVRLFEARQNQIRLETALAMARTAAHELNQQLTVLQAELDLLGFDQPLDDATKQIMYEAVAAMSEQIRQYQRLTRVVVSQNTAGFEIVNLKASTKSAALSQPEQEI